MEEDTARSRGLEGRGRARTLHGQPDQEGLGRWVRFLWGGLDLARGEHAPHTGPLSLCASGPRPLSERRTGGV